MDAGFTQMNDRTAKAIVYAVRQSHIRPPKPALSWEEIEVNTANILAGCSVPADGKMNSAEAVCRSIKADNESQDPRLVEHLQGVITRQIDSLRRIKGERDAQNQRANQAEKDNAELLRLLQAERDRDDYRAGAQARDKLVKLRTYLENVVRCPMSGDTNSLKHILEQTK